MSKIIERIRKMLALAANNPSAEEAAVAAAKAQALIDEHAIDIALLSAQEAPEGAKLQEVEERVVYAFNSRNLTHWKVQIAHGVCRASGLYSWSGWDITKRVVKAAGPLTQLVAAEILTDWLVREVESLWKAHGAKGFGRSYANSFRMGCAAEISKRLKEAAAESHREAKRRASLTTEEAYEEAIAAQDTDALAELDAGAPRYGLAIVRKAFALVEEQKDENKAWAREKHDFVSAGYGGTSRGGGWGSGVAAGKRAKIKAPGRIK